MKHAPIIAIAILAAALAGCSDSTTPNEDSIAGAIESVAWSGQPPPPDAGSEPWHALASIEIAYKHMDVNGYRKYVIDPDYFTFHFSTADFNAGNTPESWGYDEEMQSATNMLTGQPDKNGEHAILSIQLELYDIENAVWTDVEPPAEFAGETWKQTVVNYTYVMATDGGLYYIPQGTPAVRFTVRKANGLWRVVDWADLAGTYTITAASPSGIEETTWGAVKARYQY